MKSNNCITRYFAIIGLLFLTLLSAKQASADPPGWVPPSGLQYNMMIIAQLQYADGTISLNAQDIIGAFVGNECRGVGNPISSFNGLIFLTVSSNIQSGEEITFKAYIQSDDLIADIAETLGFENQGEVGTISTPYQFIVVPPCLDASANAGPDAEIIENESSALSGAAENYTGLLWETSGDGTFESTTVLQTIYYPGSADLATGTAELCLTAYATEPCEDASDCLTLTINPLPGEITNATAAQRTDGSKLLDVYYDLTGGEPAYDVAMQVSFDDGQNYQPVAQVSGDAGTVSPGTGKQITWDAGAEFPDGFYSQTVKVKVVADIHVWECGELIIDERDGQEYSTVQIGDQCWMAENLNIGTLIDGTVEMTDNGAIEKYCYDNSESNCDIYGGLYQWNEMMQYTTIEGVQGICPDGWHLPSDEEWTILSDYLGGENIAGGKMKTTGTIQIGTGLWNSPNTGATNSSGFSGLPGSHRESDGSFGGIGEYCGCWSSTKNPLYAIAWRRVLYSSYFNVGRDTNVLDLGRSVRCVWH